MNRSKLVAMGALGVQVLQTAKPGLSHGNIKAIRKATGHTDNLPLSTNKIKSMSENSISRILCS